MGRLQPDTEELPTVKPAFTPEQIQAGLQGWARNLETAKADGDILATNTALEWIDKWLDRLNGPKC
jgi:hypothetical protein